MQDTDLYADVTEHNGPTWQNDVFELFFKPADEKPGYYEFEVNPANTTMELFIPLRGQRRVRPLSKDHAYQDGDGSRTARHAQSLAGR